MYLSGTGKYLHNVLWCKDTVLSSMDGDVPINYKGPLTIDCQRPF